MLTYTLCLQSKGKYSFRVRTKEYERIINNKFDPYCEESTIEVTAEVIESGRGTTQSADLVIPLGANQVILSFTDDTAQLFRAGLSYRAMVGSLNVTRPAKIGNICT